MDETSGLVDTGAEVRSSPSPSVIAWGEIDVSTVARLEAALEAAIETGGSGVVVVDLTEVTFIDSSGLGALVAGLKQAQQRGGTLVVRGIQGAPRKVFEITGLLDVFQAD